MRNIYEYPVTNEEAIQNLKEFKQQFANERLVGDMRPTICDFIISKLEKELAI